MEAHKGFKLQNQELETCLCEVRTGCGTEVAPRSATKEDGCPFSVVTSEAHSVGSTQQFRVLGLCHDAMTAQLSELILKNKLAFRRPFG